MENRHKDNCRYNNTDKLLYAYMDIGVENREILIAANEWVLFDTYLEKAKNKDEAVNIDYDESDYEPYQIIYGALIYDSKNMTLEEVSDLSMKMKNCAMISLEDDRVSVSGYADIELYPSNALSENFIPFAVLMQTPYRLENMEYSITIFPALHDHYVWESMVNRPFLLACRKSSLMAGISIENWRQYINNKEMLEAYKVSDLYIDNKTSDHGVS